METQPHSSSFGSDPPAEIANGQGEIRRAAQRNAVQHRHFFLLNLDRLGFDPILDQVEIIANNADPMIWRKAAHRFGIDPKALDVLDRIPVRYPYYFCDPAELVKSPSLVAYYRNMAMVSTQVMQDIGLDTADHEAGQPLSSNKAEQLAQYFNSTVSASIIENPSLITSRLHIAMVFSNLGESIGNSWQNEVGE
jgi:hypothetical protein